MAYLVTSLEAFAGILPKPRRPTFKYRSKATRRFRTELNRILGQHNWATRSQSRHEDFGKLLTAAKKLRDELHHRNTTMNDIMGWHIRQRLAEASIARRVFPPKRYA